MAFNFLLAIKIVLSLTLLIFSIVMVMALIWHRETKISREVHPALAYVALWFSIIWLSMVEGIQGSLVGLKTIQTDLYRQSHLLTYKSVSMTNKGDNLDRFLVGRQFLVLFLIFVINMAGAPRDDGAKLWRLPEWIIKTFLESGVANMLMTTNIGQLPSQINVSSHMLDFVNACMSNLTVYAGLAMEYSGMFHAVYFFQQIFSCLKGTRSTLSREPPRSLCQNLFFWARIIMSLALLGFSLAVTLKGLLQGKTTMWPGVRRWASILLFFFLMLITGLLEGIQTAVYGVSKMGETFNSCAGATANTLLKNEARNIPKFMIGRQILVTMCYFFIAKITTQDVNVWDDRDDNVFSVRNWTQKLFNTGLLSALVTTVFGSLFWQMLASAFPVSFLTNPLVTALTYICLFLEATGICSASWLLAWIQKKAAGFKRDEVYIGNAGDRADRKYPDEDEEIVPGRLYPSVPTYPPTEVGIYEVGEEDDDIESN